MKIEHKNNDRNGKFSAMVEGKEIAEMTYKKSNVDSIIIDHTFVEESHRKNGVASKLVKEAVDYARETGISIIPQCPFAKDEFKENPSYNDVLA